MEENTKSLFYVDSAYSVLNDNKLVLNGRVVNGIINSNMTMLVPLNRSLFLSIKIRSIEDSDTISNGLKIYIDCEDEEEVELLLALNLEKQSFRVVD